MAYLGIAKLAVLFLVVVLCTVLVVVLIYYLLSIRPAHQSHMIVLVGPDHTD